VHDLLLRLLLGRCLVVCTVRLLHRFNLVLMLLHLLLELLVLNGLVGLDNLLLLLLLLLDRESALRLGLSLVGFSSVELLVMLRVLFLDSAVNGRGWNGDLVGLLLDGDGDHLRTRNADLLVRSTRSIHFVLFVDLFLLLQLLLADYLVEVVHLASVVLLGLAEEVGVLTGRHDSHNAERKLTEGHILLLMLLLLLLLLLSGRSVKRGMRCGIDLLDSVLVGVMSQCHLSLSECLRKHFGSNLRVLVALLANVTFSFLVEPVVAVLLSILMLESNRGHVRGSLVQIVVEMGRSGCGVLKLIFIESLGVLLASSDEVRVILDSVALLFRKRRRVRQLIPELAGDFVELHLDLLLILIRRGQRLLLLLLLVLGSLLGVTGLLLLGMLGKTTYDTTKSLTSTWKHLLLLLLVLGIGLLGLVLVLTLSLVLLLRVYSTLRLLRLLLLLLHLARLLSSDAFLLRGLLLLGNHVLQELQGRALAELLLEFSGKTRDQ